MGECIAKFSYVEASLFTVFEILAGGTRSDAFTIFTTVESESVRDALVSALLSKHHPEPIQQLYRAINSLRVAKRKTRNRLAHGEFGFIQGRDDLLLVHDPRKVATLQGADWRDHVLVYHKDELFRFLGEAGRVKIFLDFFSMVISPGMSRSERDGIFAQLSAEPEIKERLDLPARKSQSPPPK